MFHSTAQSQHKHKTAEFVVKWYTFADSAAVLDDIVGGGGRVAACGASSLRAGRKCPGDKRTHAFACGER